MGVRAIVSFAVLSIVVAPAFGEEAPEIPENPLFPPDREIERLGTGYAFTEGPALAPDGSIYFTDIPNDRILRYDPDADEIEIARDPAGGANGLMFDPEGRLLIAGHNDGRHIGRWHVETDAYETLVTHYEGTRLNSPNDLDYDQHGGIYFTDPRYGNRDDMEMDLEGVYYLDADGELHRLFEDAFERPNGILVSRDQSTLWIADEAGLTVYAYEILGPGELGEQSVAGRMDPDGGSPGPDGLTEDRHGRLYACGQGAVWAWDPDTAELIARIPLPESPANLTFGDDGRTLYVTARTSLYRMQLDLAP